MLLILAIILFFSSLIVIFLQKSKEAIYISALCIGLVVFFAGVMLFIAKKGGYSPEIIKFLFGSVAIKTKIQYIFVTLNTTGYIIAVGRYVFPIFLMLIAISYSRLGILKNKKLVGAIITLPMLVLLVVYYPKVYHGFIINNSQYRAFVAGFSYFLVVAYVIMAVIILLHELFSIKRKIFRRQFAMIVVFLVSISALFLLYCGQDPAQVYRFYSFSQGLGYLQFNVNVNAFWFIVLVNILCAIIGFIGFIRYTGDIMHTENEAIVFEKRFNITRSSISIFVHGIKNQLLTNRVLFKRINAELQKDSVDKQSLLNYMEKLNENNEAILDRTELLYLSVKSRSATRTALNLESLCKKTVSTVLKKHPDANIYHKVYDNIYILADETQMCEALGNMLINAWEAQLLANKTNEEISLKCYLHHGNVVIEIRDKGIGIAPRLQHKIFEPFYSNKNSNFNWGLGLWNARNIIRGHGGSLKLDSKQGQGTSFYISLKPYKNK